jgi:hypothetical protein
MLAVYHCIYGRNYLKPRGLDLNSRFYAYVDRSPLQVDISARACHWDIPEREDGVSYFTGAQEAFIWVFNR